jgi:hypothetical protein
MHRSQIPDSGCEGLAPGTQPDFQLSSILFRDENISAWLNLVKKTVDEGRVAGSKVEQAG